MKGAGGCAALADARRANGISIPLEPLRQQSSVHDRNHRAQVADHGHETFPGPASMDIAVPPPHGTERRTEISTHRIEDRLAEGQPASSIADERGKYVAFAQAQANGSAQSFLAAPEKHATMDFAHAIKTGEFVIQNARQQHESIGFNVRGMN